MADSIFNNPEITKKVKDNLSYFVNSKYPNYFSREDIEDLVQDSWKRLLTCKNGYQSELSQPQTFLTSIAKNLAINMYKKRASQKDVIAGSEEYESRKDKRISDSAQTVMKTREQLDWVNREISKMGPDVQILVNGLAEGMSYKELEEKTGIKAGTLAVKMSRVRDKLSSGSCYAKETPPVCSDYPLAIYIGTAFECNCQLCA